MNAVLPETKNNFNLAGLFCRQALGNNGLAVAILSYRFSLENGCNVYVLCSVLLKELLF